MSTTPSKKILLVDNDRLALNTYRALLTRFQYVVDVAESGAEALRLDDESLARYRAAIIDWQMPEMNGLELSNRLRDRMPSLHCIILTAYGSPENRRQAGNYGFRRFIEKNTQTTEQDLSDTLSAIFSLPTQVLQCRTDWGKLFLGQSQDLTTFVDKLRRVAASDVTVLLEGERGTGKRRFATHIHNLSSRRTGPFVHKDCSGITESLCESEIWGAEPGAWTDRKSVMYGIFERAHSGTLFLDELQGAPLYVQQKLKVPLETKAITRLGGRQEIKVNARIIGATNRRLEELVAVGTFLEDLKDRFEMATLRVPPLREYSAEDIATLADQLFAHHRALLDRDIEGFDDAACASITGYSWPGNIRELENKIITAILYARGSRITAGDLDLPTAGGIKRGNPTSQAGRNAQDLRAKLASVEELLSGGQTTGEIGRQLHPESPNGAQMFAHMFGRKDTVHFISDVTPQEFEARWPKLLVELTEHHPGLLVSKKYPQWIQNRSRKRKTPS